MGSRPPGTWGASGQITDARDVAFPGWDARKADAGMSIDPGKEA